MRYEKISIDYLTRGCYNIIKKYIRGVIMKLTHEIKLRIAELYNEGLGYKAIAKELGLKREQVRGFVGTVSAKETYKIDYKYMERSYIADEERKKLKEAKDAEKLAKLKIKESNKREQELRVAALKLASKISYLSECKGCNNRFLANNRRHLYCSDDCKKIIKICSHCRREYKASNSSKDRFCSRACAIDDMKKPHKEYMLQLIERHKGSIVPLDLYDGDSTKLRFKCLVCNEEFNKQPSSLVKGDRVVGCPNCRRYKSSGEELIAEWLEENNKEYIREVTFDGLNNLRYDYGVYEKGNLISLIEYDGVQHFKPIKQFGGELEYKRTVISDNTKNDYAKLNNIPLIRISYTDKHKINDILKERLH